MEAQGQLSEGRGVEQEAGVASGVGLPKAHLSTGQTPRLGVGARPGAGSGLLMSPI